MAYDLEPVKAPRAAGSKLRMLNFLVENPVTGPLLKGVLLSQVGVTQLRQTSTDMEPFRHRELTDKQWVDDQQDIEKAGDISELDLPVKGFQFPAAADFVSAYKEGRADPVQVARRFTELAQQARDQGMGLFIATNARDLEKQAEASARRYQDGRPVGPLDGVPIAVKDEIDQSPYPTTVGTGFLGGSGARRDAFAVARLRKAGALLVGKANMHEIGIGVTGINPHYGPARNPYDPTRITGGSSSGPAAIVGSGLCPIAVGADGGGSIRIPAGFCGVVGLKPTFGRVSEQGAAPLCWSLAHIGPIAATVQDAALAYSIMAGADPDDPNSRMQPRPTLGRLFAKDLDGVKLGIYTPWFEDAQPQVVEAAYRVVDVLKSEGAVVREVDIPDLSVLRGVHLVTIVSEMVAAHITHYRSHRKEYGVDTRMSMALGRALTSYDYVHAQRLRSEISKRFLDVLKKVDVIITPTTGLTAPRIPLDALKTGESNLNLTTKIMQYAQAANLTGIPAITFPAGYDELGMPIGFQAMGRPWQEDLLLRLAASAQVHVERRKPKVFFDVLGL